MSKEYNNSYDKILVDYQAIAEIVLGTWSVFYAVETWIAVYYYEDEFSRLYYWFVAAAVLEILKGFLLLVAIKKQIKSFVLVYLLLTILFLVVAKGFVISFGIERFEEIEEAKKTDDDESEIKMLIRLFIFDYVIFLPSVFLFHWFILFHVYRFYKKLAKTGKTEKKIDFFIPALCAPSRNSFLTSRRPDSLHLYDFYSYWRTSVGNFTTLPQLFKENGYYTQSIGKVFHPGISSNSSDDSPYSWSGEPFHPKTEAYKEAKVCPDSDGNLARNLVCPVIVGAQPGGTLPDLESLVAALEFMEHKDNITGGKPFFLAVGFHKPHVPLKYPIEYLDFHPLDQVVLPKYRHRPPLMPTVAWNPWLDVKGRDDVAKLNVSFPFGAMPDNVTKLIIRSYNAATTYIDDLFGFLLAKVDPNNTIVVLTSDHGWSRGEHGEFSKFSTFDVATQVPLIVHVPGLSNVEVIVDDLVELVDLFPTLVDLTQVAPALETCSRNGTNSKLCTEGRSLVPTMVAKAGGKRAVFSQYPRPGAFPTNVPDSDRPRLKDINIMGYSIRTSRYRYTEWIKFNHTSFMPDWSQVYGKELYDHMIDPLESLNLVSRPELGFVTSSLHKQLILGWRYA